MARRPTAPPAPVTAIGLSPGRRPQVSKRSSAIAAVKPGTPMMAACRGVSPSGTCCRWRAGTRMTSESPPSKSIPVWKPCTSTASPGLKAASSEATTSPTASMPGMRG